MSKRLSGNQSNTLFNYFKSPQSVKTPSKSNGVESKPTSKTEVDSKKRQLEEQSPSVDSIKKPRLESNDETASTSDECSPAKTPSRRKRRLLCVLSDSDDEEKKENESGRRQTPSRKCISDSEDEENEPANLNETQTSTRKGLSSFKFTKRLDDSVTETEVKALPKKQDNTFTFSEKVWKHNEFDFLKPDKIRDIKKNRLDHPDYDPKTLFVPPDFLNSLTPAMRQWWILKSEHYDCILFFKVGKFYELYHMDAVTAVNNLGLTFMKGDFAHSGFPEIAYGRMASSLIDQNFKVARVEQTETPEMMQARCKLKGRCDKFDKVVAREICQVSTKGTCMYGAQITDAKQALPCYMIAISESVKLNKSTFGVCFVDTSIGTLHLGQFTDDKHYSKLLFLFAQYPPGLVLLEKGCLKQETTAAITNALGSVRCEKLISKTQFYLAQKTVDTLAQGCYFRDKNDHFAWPEAFTQFIHDGCPKPEYELSLKALGACIWYLKDSELDMQVLCMKKFEAYEATNFDKAKPSYMVLDQNTVKNLNLLGDTGTLQKTIDYCKTSFGKRLLLDWICRPLCDENKISERQKAVKELYDNNDLRQSIEDILKVLPDLERQVTKIHIFGNKFCAESHPDSRAILYENKSYSKTKIKDFITTLKGFEKAQELLQLASDSNSKLLNNILKPPPEGQFIDLSESLRFFEAAFDRKQAETEGKIMPQRGVDDEYDESENAIEEIKKELEAYLEEQEEFFGCKLTYFGSDKKRFQLEVPQHRVHKANADYFLEGNKKGSKPANRYTTAATKQFLADMIKAENKRTKIINDLNRRIFEKFGDRREQWDQCICCLKVLDVLYAFAEYARKGPQNICFPTILPFQEQPVVDIEEGVHPSILLDDFVPNDTKLGVEDLAPLMLLTGPNMGGKSTLMRQVALIIIMAQMGCPVPATNCKISLVDRIFTRLGANDDILKGQSTFLVELSEASSILQHATCHSFVLLDELGRGTSTHDGNAIATAYVHKLIDINCRTIFSTHYHSLVDRYMANSKIQLAHMACMSDDDNDESSTEITLLYLLQKGRCPKSYGFNAAKLAGLPEEILKLARIIANEQEYIFKARKLLQELLLAEDASTIRNSLTILKL